MANKEKNMKKAEQLESVVEKIKGILEDVLNPVDTVVEFEDSDLVKSEELSDEEISKSYDSDNQDEDKWDNIAKACWSGYKQVGMKEKNGKKVPNCVPVEKMDNEEDEKKKPKKEMKKSLWGGAFSTK